MSHPTAATDLETIFTRKFRTNHWGSTESVSGPGSELVATTEVRDAIGSIIDRYEVHTITDAGCGDFHWQPLVPGLLDTHYLGLDIVDDLVKLNNARYAARANIHFQHCDITRDPSPPADLVIARDSLVHLSTAHVQAALANIISSGSALLLATTYPGLSRNLDTDGGHWRPLNLTLGPFHLPEPLEFINTDYTDGGRHHPGNGLGLWTIESLLDQPAS
jgi:hypothetical protein